MTAAPPGGPCQWAYCSVWATVVVEPPPGTGLEPMLVCAAHLAHASLKGYRITSR
jgi:hypothetical protein